MSFKCSDISVLDHRVLTTLQIRAKSVMERDLTLIRTKRAERERAAGALKAKISVANMEGNQRGNVSDAMEITRSVPPVEGPGKPGLEDIVMMDHPADLQYEKHESIGPGTISKALESKKTVSALQELPRDSNNSKGLAISIDMKPSNNMTSSPQVGTTRENNDEMSEQHLETPTTANLRDTDFETMFNDTENAGGDDVMDFDLGFPTDNKTNQEIMNSSSFQNIAMNNDDLKNFNATSNEDLNTLLPGLETFVNAGDDFSIGIPTTSAQPENITNTKKAATISAPQDFVSAAVESNFDDLFSSEGFAEGAGNYDMSGNGNIDDIEDLDEWFKTDIT